MGIFKIKGKNDPEGTHRSMLTLFLVKHKDKKPVPEPNFEQEQKNPVLPKQEE